MTDSFDKIEYRNRLTDAWTQSVPAIYSLFMNNAVDETTGKELEQATIKFSTVETLGEVKAKPMSEQSTELKRFKTGTKTKDYIKYCNGIGWKRKSLNADYDAFASISNQALNKILVQEDEEFITGMDANGVIRNNGLFNSNDPDYVTETQTGGAPSTLSALKNNLDADLKKIRKEAQGQKYVFSWGAVHTALTSFPTEDSLRTKQLILQENLPDVTFINTISDITGGATGASVGLGGYLIVTPAAVRMHHNLLTQIHSLGFNEEEMRIWLNIVYGSKSLEVLAKLGIFKKIFTA